MRALLLLDLYAVRRGSLITSVTDNRRDLERLDGWSDREQGWWQGQERADAGKCKRVKDAVVRVLSGEPTSLILQPLSGTRIAVHLLRTVQTTLWE